MRGIKAALLGGALVVTATIFLWPRANSNLENSAPETEESEARAYTGPEMQETAVQQPASDISPSIEDGVTPNSIIRSNDLNGDGIVTREEAENSKRSLILLWDRYDADMDGKVDVEEIERVSAAVAANSVTLPSGSSIVANNDVDGDGIVTRAEAAQTNKSLHRLWDMYDLNKDGKVDSEEIEKASGR